MQCREEGLGQAASEWAGREGGRPAPLERTERTSVVCRVLHPTQPLLRAFRGCVITISAAEGWRRRGQQAADRFTALATSLLRPDTELEQPLMRAPGLADQREYRGAA